MASIKALKPRSGTKSRFKQGYFDVSKSLKYIQNGEPCIYRSGYEFKFMLWCESTEYISKWSSEPYPIPYTCLVTGKQRKYWIDFHVDTNKPEKWLIEVKPGKEVADIEKFGRILNSLTDTAPQKKWILSNQSAAKNWSKWLHAKKFSANNGCRFIIVTEKFLNSH